MTICFIGNSFKYEIEAVMKLFLPLTAFDFLFEEYAGAGDVCVVERTESRLSVRASLNGEAAEETGDRLSCDKEDEAKLCRMLYGIMRRLTGITPAWGCLTGIRPVKKVNAMLGVGMSKKEIFDALKRDYFVSDGKLELAYQTALVQTEPLKASDRLSYSLYISVPFCPSRCSYCSFVSHSIESPGAKKLLPEYVKILCGEIADTAAVAAGLGLRLETVYIGGGTPTALSAEQLEAVMAAVKKNFDISKIREYTVEAGRSDTVTEKKLEIIRDFGGTRISVNPQTMNDSVLKAIGRRHTAEDVVNVFRTARRLGFSNINMDTIAGLPTDTPESFARTIDILCGLDPESITVHTLTVKRSSRLFSEEEMSIDGRVDEMTEYGQKKLMNEGYVPYYLYRQKNTVGNLENVGFAKPGYECLYNIYIMEEAQTILAVGAGASTKLVNTETGKIVRLFNYKYPYEYISRYDKMAVKNEGIYDFFGNTAQSLDKAIYESRNRVDLNGPYDTAEDAVNAMLED